LTIRETNGKWAFLSPDEQEDSSPQSRWRDRIFWELLAKKTTTTTAKVIARTRSDCILRRLSRLLFSSRK
jgi:hypothetical protein